MRLINVRTRQFEVFEGSNVPKYAILSHTWGANEVLYADFVNATKDESRLNCYALPWKAQEGYVKIELSCKQAERDDLEYVWIDTCCIDKSSSADLSESINSMFRYYRESSVCYAFLSDYKKPEVDFQGVDSCRWFTRGWTLQELIAPTNVQFYDKEWSYLGSKYSMSSRLSQITGIQEEILRDSRSISEMSVAQRMSWMTNADGRCRQTTRVEDLAYCLIGIMGINLTLLYGESLKSFIRLQDETLKETDDQSIFAWTDRAAAPDDWCGLFASHPKHFSDCKDVVSFTDWKHPSLASITSSGLSINLPLLTFATRADLFIANLNCRRADSDEGGYSLAIYLYKMAGEGSNYVRVLSSSLRSTTRSVHFQQIYVRQQPVAPKAGDLNLENRFRVDINSEAANCYLAKYVIYKDDADKVIFKEPDADTIYRLYSEKSLSAAFFLEDWRDPERFWVLLGCGETPGCVSHSITYTIDPARSPGGVPYIPFIKALNNADSAGRWSEAKILRALEKEFKQNMTDEPVQLRDGRTFDSRYHLEVGNTGAKNLIVTLRVNQTRNKGLFPTA